jgi:hypothetical protein
MAGTALPEIRDFYDVVRALDAHPEWRADLRRLILTDELLALPEQIGLSAAAERKLTLRTLHLGVLEAVDKLIRPTVSARDGSC